MTIQSDRQIRALCEYPLGHVRFGIKAGHAMVEMREPLYFDAHKTLDELANEEMARHKDVRGQGLVEVTPQDRWENYKQFFTPMIEPFLPRQEREVERNGTEEEMWLLKGMGEAWLRKHLGANRITNIRVDPLLGLQIRERILSKGLTSYGYDVSLAPEFKIFTNLKGEVIDPLNFDEECLLTDGVIDAGGWVILPPNSYLLGRTVEYFRMPRNMVALAVGKSTYARCGAIVNVTPVEPGFCGHVVIEVSNSTNSPLKIYVNQGIAQFMFFKGEPVAVAYSDRNGGDGGKYQNQTGITLARG